MTRRTTIAIEEDLFRKIKQGASRHGETLKSYLNALLRKALASPPKGKGYKFHWKPVDGDLKPGVNIADRDALYEIMEGRR